MGGRALQPFTSEAWLRGEGIAAVGVMLPLNPTPRQRKHLDSDSRGLELPEFFDSQYKLVSYLMEPGSGQYDMVSLQGSLWEVPARGLF